MGVGDGGSGGEVGGGGGGSRFDVAMLDLAIA